MCANFEREGITIIVISHQPDKLMSCSRFAKIAVNGQITTRRATIVGNSSESFSLSRFAEL